MHSFKIHKYVNDPKFKQRMAEKVKIDRNYDVPYVAGYSKDGKTIFVDRHLLKMKDEHDIEPYLLVHEKTEKALIDIFGLDYQHAHHIAMEQEKEAVAKGGLEWSAYEKHYNKFIKGCSHEKLQKVPVSLDMTPYKDEKDFNLLRDMEKHEVK